MHSWETTASRSIVMTSKRRYWPEIALVTALMLFCGNSLAQQQAPFPAAQQGPPGQQQNALPGPQTNNFGPLSGLEGGAEDADFDSLIDLIVSTVAVDTWAESGGGQAEIRPFPTGVLVNASESLKLLKSDGGPVEPLIRQRPPTVYVAPTDPRRQVELRYVSLPRLEREIARCQAERQPLDLTMLTLAGLQRVEYVLLYPETGDLVLAGPAGDWRVDESGQILAAESGQPIVRLDDFLVLLRRGLESPDSDFGCAITPRQESLAATQEYLNKSSARPIAPGRRDDWLANLRGTLGKQDIEVFGIDRATRVAAVLVEADYHMKLIGMGIEEGVAGVTSYLEMLPASDGPAPMSVLRWWFTMSYRAIAASADGNAYAILGQGVRVLSENELLTQRGERVHTGQSDPLNQQFAGDFTAQYELLCQKYPIYADLRNAFDLSLVVALIQREQLFARVGWTPTVFADAERLRLPRWAVPTEVDTVINHREMSRRHFVVGVSGGVLANPDEILKKPREVKRLTEERREVPANLDAAHWWWDFEAPGS
ncbi:MAG: DUF1598 domain-containing protein [Pirellulaceae bacterium]